MLCQDIDSEFVLESMQFKYSFTCQAGKTALYLDYLNKNKREK